MMISLLRVICYYSFLIVLTSWIIHIEPCHGANNSANVSISLRKKNHRSLKKVDAIASNNIRLSPIQIMASGGLARMAAQMMLYPVDTMRTLAQARTGAKTLAELGTETLVRGCVMTSLFALPTGSAQFFTNQKVKTFLNGKSRGENEGVSTVAVNLQASIAAACASLVFTIPQEVIKQRLQTGIFGSFRQGVQSLWKEEGIRGFYTGAFPTAARNVPFVVITFTMFGSIEKRFMDRKDKEEESKGLSSLELLAAGIGAATVGCLITQPVDVIKTRMMTQAASNLTPYTSVLDCVGSIFRDEGVSTFYTGMKQRYFYMAPLWAIQFALNNNIQDRFRKYNAQQKLE